MCCSLLLSPFLCFYYLVASKVCTIKLFPFMQNPFMYLMVGWLTFSYKYNLLTRLWFESVFSDSVNYVYGRDFHHFGRIRNIKIQKMKFLIIQDKITNLNFLPETHIFAERDIKYYDTIYHDSNVRTRPIPHIRQE